VKTGLIFIASAVVAVAQNHTPGLLDVRRIVEASIAATERDWLARDHYTYIETDEDRRLDSRGQMQSEDVDVSTVLLVNGASFEQLIKHNGMPPSAAEQRKQEAALRKLAGETPEQRAVRLREEQANRSFIREVPLGFVFQLIGEDVVNGRLAYVLQATPNPAYQPRGKYGKMFSRVGGKLWIDKQDFGWVKVDGTVIQPLSMGLFLARVQPGSHIRLEQIRVGDGIWMPKRVEVRVSARILLVMNYDADRILTWSDYLPARQASLVSLASRQPTSK
jgi:hypothetical protein